MLQKIKVQRGRLLSIAKFVVDGNALTPFGVLTPTEATTTNALIRGAYTTFRCFRRTGDRYYSLPGMQFAMDMRPDSNAVASPFAQERLQSSVVCNLTRGSKARTRLNLDADPDEQLSTMPYCFIADTDSITVALDTGANRIIVNEKYLLTNFRVSKERVKGLQGKPITAGGQGRSCLNLESVDGHVEAINHLAIYCPTSPYNLAPPQLLVRVLKK